MPFVSIDQPCLVQVGQHSSHLIMNSDLLCVQGDKLETFSNMLPSTPFNVAGR